MNRTTPPHPDCVWNEVEQVWIWPDDRSESQKEADERAAQAAESGDWERFGFTTGRTSRIDGRPAGPPPQKGA